LQILYLEIYKNIVFCLIAFGLNQNLIQAQCGLDLSPFGIISSEILFKSKEDINIDAQKVSNKWVDEYGYEIIEFYSEIEISNFRKTVEKKYIFKNEVLKGFILSFPVELSEFKNIIRLLKERYNYDFINEENRFYFWKQEELCKIILRIRSVENGFLLELKLQ